MAQPEPEPDEKSPDDKSPDDKSPDDKSPESEVKTNKTAFWGRMAGYCRRETHQYQHLHVTPRGLGGSAENFDKS